MAKKATVAISRIVTPVPTSDDECDDRILQLGEARRALAQAQADLDAAIARAKATAETAATPLRLAIEGLEEAIEAYCSDHRSRLTDDGKVKFYRFGNGTVSWRAAPAKVTLRSVDKILDWLIENRKRFARFIRVKHEIDKETMLKFPDLAREVPGVKIASAGEFFAIEPVGAELEQPK